MYQILIIHSSVNGHLSYFMKTVTLIIKPDRVIDKSKMKGRKERIKEGRKKRWGEEWTL